MAKKYETNQIYRDLAQRMVCRTDASKIDGRYYLL